MSQGLKYAGLFGIISIILLVPSQIIPILDFSMIPLKLLLTLNVLYAVSYILLIIGFMLIGKKIENPFLFKASSWMIGYLILSPALSTIGFIFPLLGVGIPILSIIQIIFGIALIKAKERLGNIAYIAGIINISIPISALVLGFLAPILTIAVLILQTIILFRASKSLDALPQDNTRAPLQ